MAIKDNGDRWSISALASFQIDVRHAASFSGLNMHCLRFARSMAVKAIAYHHLPQLGSIDGIALNIVSLGFPKNLAIRYEEEDLIKVDPSIRFVMSGTKPYWWDGIEYPARLKPTEKAFLESIILEDVGEVLMVPVFGPNGRNGFVALGFGQMRPQTSEDNLIQIQTCCQMAHQQYCDLLLSGLPQKAKLSARENEIMSWVAQGKSNGVIADIIGITESTVVTYLERAFVKLGVNSRVTAALRAVSLGEL